MAQPTDRTVTVAFARGLVFGAASLGVPVDTLLRTAGFDETTLADEDARLTGGTGSRLFAALVDITGDASIALRLAQVVNPIQDHVLSYIFRASPTYGAGLRSLLRYERLIQDVLHSTLEVEGAVARLSYTSDLDVTPAAMEFPFAAKLRWITQEFGLALRPTRVTFRHAAPANLAPYEATFGPKIEWDSERNSLEFESSWLDHPLHTSDATLMRILEPLAQQALESLPKLHAPKDGEKSTMVRDLRFVLKDLIRDGEVSVSQAARILRVSSRTLQRRLQECDTSFASVLDDLRRDLALAYLGESTLNVAQISYLVGFSDQSAFHRAFTRWVGDTPCRWRTGQRTSAEQSHA